MFTFSKKSAEKQKPSSTYDGQRSEAGVRQTKDKREKTLIRNNKIKLINQLLPT